MTVNELRKKLKEFDGDLVVRLAVQPDYPMASGVGEVKEFSQPNYKTYGEDTFVYIQEVGHKGYLPAEICRCLGWTEIKI